MIPIDLQPPHDWLSDFPLSRSPIKKLKEFFECAVSLPQTLQEFQKDISFDESSVEEVRHYLYFHLTNWILFLAQFREYIDLLVDFFIKFRTHAQNYNGNILSSINSIPRILKSYIYAVEPSYRAIYSAIDDLKDKGADHDSSRMIIGGIAHRVTSQMNRLSDVAEVIVGKLTRLKDEINDDKAVIPAIISRLKTKKSIRHEDEASPLEYMRLEYVLWLDMLQGILENINITITIVSSMRDQFLSIRDGFDTIRENTRNEAMGFISPDFIARDPPEHVVFRKWNELLAVINVGDNSGLDRP